MLVVQHEDQKRLIDHAQAFFGQRGRGQNNRGGHL